MKSEKFRIFISLGSSGYLDGLPSLLKLLAAMDVEVIVALAGIKIDLPQYENVFMTDFLPLDLVLQQVGLVICNGGSPLCHAALSCGVSVIGIICNNDHLLNMPHVEQRRAGIMLRYWNAEENILRETIEKILSDESSLKAAKQIQAEFSKYDLKIILLDLVRDHI